MKFRRVVSYTSIAFFLLLCSSLAWGKGNNQSDLIVSTAWLKAHLGDSGVVIVHVEEVESFLRDSLMRLGLNEPECRDFLEAWLPLLDDAPYYFISFFDRRSIDALAPLEVTPAPDTVIRVLMDYRPLEGWIEVAPQELGPPPRREGFTLVEWGGLRR